MRRDKNRPEGLHQRITSRIRGVPVGGLSEAIEEVDDLVYTTSASLGEQLPNIWKYNKESLVRKADKAYHIHVEIDALADKDNFTETDKGKLKDFRLNLASNLILPKHIEEAFNAQVEQIARQTFLTEREKEQLHKYVLSAKKELHKDYITFLNRTEKKFVEEYNKLMQDQLYTKSVGLEKSIAEKVAAIYSNTSSVIPDEFLLNALGLDDTSKTITGFTKPRNMLTEIGKLGVRSVNKNVQDELSSDIALIIANLNKKQVVNTPQPFVKEKPNPFSHKLIEARDKLRLFLKNKFLPLTRVTNKVATFAYDKIRNTDALADKLVHGAPVSVVRRTMIKEAMLSFVKNSDFYCRDKRALNEDAALLIDRLFSKDSNKKDYTKDSIGSTDRHFEVLCKIADKYGALSKERIAGIRKELNTIKPSVESLPIGTWQREQLRRKIDTSRYFHSTFDSYIDDRRLELAAKRRVNYLYSYQTGEATARFGIPNLLIKNGYSPKVNTADDYIKRMRQSKERFALNAKATYTPAYVQEKNPEAKKIERINSLVSTKLTEHKLRIINPRFLRSLFKKDFTPTEKQNAEFKKLLFGEEEVPYNITNQELLAYSIWRLKAFYQQQQRKYAEDTRRFKLRRHNFVRDMYGFFKGILKPFAPTKEYVEKQSFIRLPDGSISMNRLDGHGIFTLHPDGSTTEDSGITTRIGYAAGSYTKNEHLPYDSFSNPIGFKEDSEESVIWNRDLTDYQRKKLTEKEEEKTYAMQKGSAIHKIVESYYKSGGKIILDGGMSREHDVLQKALVTIDTLNKRYPKNKGWEIRVEQLIPGFDNLEGFKTPIDVLAYNKWTGKVEILDLKTGHLDNLYVQLQLSTEAYMLEKYANTGFLRGIRPGIKAEDISLLSINTKAEPVKPWGDKYTAELKQHDLYKLSGINKIFSKDMWVEEKPGFLRRIKTEDIDIDALKNAAIAYSSPLFNKDLPARFGFKEVGNNLIYAPKRAITFDLETTKTDRSKNEIQSLSALSFMMDPVSNKFLFSESSEGFFLTKGVPDTLEPSELIHGLTNKGIVEINKLRGQMKSAALSMNGILNFMKAIKGNVILGHNIVEYDFSVLYAEYKRLSREKHTHKGIVRTDLVEKDKRKFAKLFSSLTIIDTLTLYRALEFDSRASYDYSSPNSLKNVDIFRKKTGWAPREGELHGSTIDSFMSSVIGEAAIHGGRDIPRQVTALLRHLFSGKAGNVTIMHGAPLSITAEGVSKSSIPFSVVPTDVSILNPHPEIDRVKTVHAHEVRYEDVPYTDAFDTSINGVFEQRDELSDREEAYSEKAYEDEEYQEQKFWEEHGGIVDFEERKVEISVWKTQIRREILPKLWNPEIKKAYLAQDAYDQLMKHVNELKSVGDDEGAMLFQWLTIAEFTKLKDEIDPVIAGKFEYLLLKGKSRKIVELLLNNPFNIEAINTQTRSLFDVNDYVSKNQLALGFLGEGGNEYLLLGKPLAFMLSQYYNEPGDIKEEYTMIPVGTNEPSANDAQVVELSGNSLSKLSEVLKTAIFSEYGGLLDKSGTIAGRLENLDFTSRRSILGTLAAKAAITKNPSELKTFEAVAGLLFEGMPEADKQMAAFNKSIQAAKEKFSDTKYLRTSLYSAMSKAGFSNGAIANVLSDKELLKSFTPNDYERIIDRASHIGVAKDYMRNVFGLDMSEKKLTALMMSDISLDKLYNPEFAKKYLNAEDALNDSRVKQIKQLERNNPLFENFDSHLVELSKLKYSDKEYEEELARVIDKTDKATTTLRNFHGVMSNISYYDPDRLFHAGYSQITNVHSSLRGLVPNVLNTSITKFMTGGVQEHELGWQKWKYGIRAAQPLFSLLGGTVGAMGAGPMGAAIGAQTANGLAAWGTQLVGNRYEKAISETGLFFASHFNKMGALLAPAMYAINLFTKTLHLGVGLLKRATIPALAGIGVGIYQYRRALNNMNNLDTPLSNLTQVGYGANYQDLTRVDYAYGMRRGTTNSIVEGIEFAKQGLFTLGKYDKNKLVASAILGVFNEAYMNPGTNGAENYKKMSDKLYNKLSAPGANKGRLMYLINEYNPELAKQMQVRMEQEEWMKTPRGQLYAARTVPKFDINANQRGEYRAISFFQSAFAEGIQNSLMKVAASLYNWKGFGFMQGLTNTVGIAGNMMAEGDIFGGLKVVWQGIKNFLTNLRTTWEEVKDALHIGSVKDTIMNTVKKIGLEVSLELIKVAKNALIYLNTLNSEGKTRIESIKDHVKSLFMLLYDKFKALFDFVNDIHVGFDWENKRFTLSYGMKPSKGAPDESMYSYKSGNDTFLREPGIGAFLTDPVEKDKILRYFFNTPSLEQYLDVIERSDGTKLATGIKNRMSFIAGKGFPVAASEAAVDAARRYAFFLSEVNQYGLSMAGVKKLLTGVNPNGSNSTYSPEELLDFMRLSKLLGMPYKRPSEELDYYKDTFGSFISDHLGGGALGSFFDPVEGFKKLKGYEDDILIRLQLLNNNGFVQNEFEIKPENSTNYQKVIRTEFAAINN